MKFFVVILMLFLLAGCAPDSDSAGSPAQTPQTSVSSPTQTQTVTAIFVPKELDTGNTNGNLLQDGLVASYQVSDYLYLDENRTQLIHESRGKKELIFSGEKLGQLNVLDDEIYLTRGAEILCLDPTTGEARTIYTYPDPFTRLTLIVTREGFFCAGYEAGGTTAGKIFALDRDGNARLLSDASNGVLSYYNGWLYYGRPMGSGIWKMKTDGSQDDLFLQARSEQFFLTEDTLYLADTDCIARMNPDGSGYRVIETVAAASINCSEAHLLYSDMDGLLYHRFRIGSTRPLGDAERGYSHPNIVWGLIFCENKDGKVGTFGFQ